MIGEVVAVTVAGFAVGAVFMALANRRVSVETAGARWLKVTVFFVIVHAVLGVAAAGRPWVTALLLLVLAAGASELRRAWQLIQVPRPACVWPVFAVIAVLALVNSWFLSPGVFAFLFLAAAACDGFSQVVGQLFGRRKLARTVSPEKTVGGLVGGLIAAVVVALLTRDLLGTGSPLVAGTLAVFTGLAGLAGDLAASWVKRRAGIKDYSAALPGQGGFLDRFDSLLGALALVGTALVLTGS